MANNSQVAHQWANQRKPNGKGSNLFFEGTDIWSYGRHFMAGRFTELNDPTTGDRIVLVNSRSYSMSTSRHMQYVRQALHGLPVRVIHVSEPDAIWRSVSQLAREYENTLKEAGKARGRRDGLIASAVAQAESLAEICAIFGERMPILSEITPELLARHAATHKETLRVTRERKAQREADEKARRIARELPLDVRMTAWRAGDRNVYMHDFPRTLLRLSGDTIYTSRGAQVPAVVAPSLWVMANRCRVRNAELIAPEGSEVGNFALRSIGADGSLIVGCHTLEFCELEFIAKELGL